MQPSNINLCINQPYQCISVSFWPYLLVWLPNIKSDHLLFGFPSIPLKLGFACSWQYFHCPFQLTLVTWRAFRALRKIEATQRMFDLQLCIYPSQTAFSPHLRVSSRVSIFLNLLSNIFDSTYARVFNQIPTFRRQIGKCVGNIQWDHSNHLPVPLDSLLGYSQWPYTAIQSRLVHEHPHTSHVRCQLLFHYGKHYQNYLPVHGL